MGNVYSVIYIIQTKFLRSKNKCSAHIIASTKMIKLYASS